MGKGSTHAMILGRLLATPSIKWPEIILIPIGDPIAHSYLASFSIKQMHLGVISADSSRPGASCGCEIFMVLWNHFKIRWTPVATMNLSRAVTYVQGAAVCLWPHPHRVVCHLRSDFYHMTGFSPSGWTAGSSILFGLDMRICAVGR